MEGKCNLICGLPETDADLRRILTPEQYAIVVRNGTERPFENAYWDHHEVGVYADVVSGEPLFASVDKFDSGTGWPSFTRPINPSVIREIGDSSFGMHRVEVRARRSNSHLGHVFNDGPAPTGLRYCINSASLRFIPIEKLREEGCEMYLRLFEK